MKSKHLDLFSKVDLVHIIRAHKSMCSAYNLIPITVRLDVCIRAWYWTLVLSRPEYPQFQVFGWFRY